MKEERIAEKFSNILTDKRNHAQEKRKNMPKGEKALTKYGKI
jgi:hypothetical protein